MSSPFDFDPELEDALERDPELMRIARMLGSAKSADPPYDAEFRATLRRRLMDQAWDSVEDRRAWWRGLFAPQRMAWASAAAVVVLVAGVVLYTAAQPPGQIIEQFPKATSPLQDQAAVNPQQAIELRFSQAMDHPSTEAAVQITPATSVAFSWSGDTVLYVQPTSGNLAPNTQYQVTVGAGARTQTGVKTSSPQTVTFVTTGEAAPSPSPTPVPSPSSNPSLLTNVRALTGDYPPSGTSYPVVWSADSSTVYFVGAGGALESVAVKDGTVKKLVADGVSLPAISASGDRLAYVRDGKVVILDVAAGTTSVVQVTAPPTALTWVGGKLYWGDATTVYRLDSGGPAKVADVSQLSGSVISIAPDGKHAIVQVNDGLAAVDVATGKSSTVCSGGCATTFQGWSPDGSRFIYGANVADPSGNTVSSIPPGDASWSTANEILLGSDTAIFEVRPDGSDYIALANGTFHQPVWAPDSTTFAFVRGSQLFVASAPAPTAAPPAVDQALRVVNQFMKARLDHQAERAASFLDPAGKAAYAGTSPALIPQGDPSFHRYYILTSEVDPTTGAVRVVVRLVFTHGKVEQFLTEEALTLVRAGSTDPYVIDAVSVGPQLQPGKGPEVVSVKVSATEVRVTFDSDLQTASVSNVTLQDANGASVSATVSYADRTVSLTGLQLTPGARYRLVVLPGIEDVGTHNAPAEYDLDLIGPPPPTTSGAGTPPSPAPSPGPTPPGSPPAVASPSPTKKS